jgi:hypothetical protein
MTLFPPDSWLSQRQLVSFSLVRGYSQFLEVEPRRKSSSMCVHLLPRRSQGLIRLLSFLSQVTLPALLFAKIIPSFTQQNISALGPICTLGGRCFV